jgi:hypothetical protein
VIKKSLSGKRPEVPASMNRTVKKLIKRCWSPDPDVHPMFDEILSSFRQINFQLRPKVDPVKIAAFISAISPAE